MAKVFRNFSEMSAALKKATDDFTKEARGLVDYNLGELELQAIRTSPGPGKDIATTHGPEKQKDIVNGRGWTPISQAIGYTLDIPSKGLKGTVFVDIAAGPIAIWTEFGTGPSASYYVNTLPPEFQAVARKYFINGKGSIIVQPYLLPAFFKYRVNFKKEMAEAVKNISF